MKIFSKLKIFIEWFLVAFTFCLITFQVMNKFVLKNDNEEGTKSIQGDYFDAHKHYYSEGKGRTIPLEGHEKK